MNSDTMDINIRVDKQEVILNEEITLIINMKNNTDKLIENVLLKNFIDNSFFLIKENIYNTVNDNFINIGRFNPKQIINIQFTLKVINIPKNYKLPIFSLLNFNLEENNRLIDTNIKSNTIYIDFYEADLYGENGENFKVTTSKNRYLLNENIDFNIKIVNTGNVYAENIYLYEYIPQNTRVPRESILTSKKNGVEIGSEFILINKIAPSEEVFIKYNAEIKPDLEEYYIENQINLDYRYITPNNIIANVKKSSNKSKISVEKKLLFFRENSFSHKVDKKNTYIGDTVTHTVYIKNSTDMSIKKLSLKEIIPLNLTFVDGSLFINGVNRVNETVENDIELGDINKNEEIIITYKTKIKSITKDYKLKVFSKISYIANFIKSIEESEPFDIDILQPKFENNEQGFTKIQNKKIASIGDEVEYEIYLKNTGNIAAKEVKLKDSIQRGMEFIQGSLLVNDIKESNKGTIDSILIPKINPNESVNIKYKAKVVDKEIQSQGQRSTITFKGDNFNKTWDSYSNETFVNVVTPKLSGKNNNSEVLKEVDNENAKVGDILTFTIFIKNTGNIACQSINIYEKFNPSLRFIDDSVSINDTFYKCESIYDGIVISKLDQEESVIITYKVKVVGLPRLNLTDDRSSISYSYILNDDIVQRTIETTQPKLHINDSKLIIRDCDSIIKDNEMIRYSNYDEYIYFKLMIENRGNVASKDIMIVLNFSKDVQLDLNSIKINNIYTEQETNDGIYIKELDAMKNAFIEFRIKNFDTALDEIEANFYVDYNFSNIEGNKTFKKFLDMKERIMMIYPSIEVNKSIQDNTLYIEDEISEVISVKNTGNIDLDDIIIDINNYEFLQLNLKKVNINGSLFNGDIYDNCININKLRQGENINLSLNYSVLDVPSHNSYLIENKVIASYKIEGMKEKFTVKAKSNEIKLDIKNDSIQVKNKVGSDFILLNDTEHYSVNLYNDGNCEYKNIKIKVNLPDGFTYLDNSFKVNGENRSLIDINNYIDIGSLSLNEYIYIEFDFKVSKVPYKNKGIIEVDIDAIFEDSYKRLKTKKITNISDIIQVESVYLEVIKKSYKEKLRAREVVNIQTTLTNRGSIDLLNINIADNKSSNLEVVENTAIINNKTYVGLDINEGININKLEGGKTITIITSHRYNPNGYYKDVKVYSDIKYKYSLKDKNELLESSTRSNPLYLEAHLFELNKFKIESEYQAFLTDPDISEVTNVSSQVFINNYYEIDTIKNKSYENQNLTGKKVIINGYVKNSIEYIVDYENNALYLIVRETPFNTFINIPSEYSCRDIEFNPKCEDTYFKVMGKKSLFITNLISIE